MKAGGMFKNRRVEQPALADLLRVENQIRTHFNLAETDLVLVSQNAGSKPGYPELVTNVTFWRGDERYRLRRFTPLADFDAGPLPVAWLLPSLRDDGDADCC